MGGPRKRFIPSTFARAHDFVFSPEDAGAQAAADAATNASHNLVPPLRFCRTGSVEKATSRLTTATVPHNGDGQKEYCGACQFADTRRCTYCHQSKLSTAHRLPLDRLASLLMREDCNKATLEICRELALYARSDAHAAETNLRLGFDVPERAMCDAHERERERLRRSRLRESEELTKCRSKLDRALRAAREAAAKHALEQSQIEAARDAAVAALEARERVIEEREVVVRESVPPEAPVHVEHVETQCYGTEAYFGDPHADAVAAALAAHAARRAELCRDKAVQTEAPPAPPPPPRRKRTTFMVRRLTPVEVAAAEAAAARQEEEPEVEPEPEEEDVIEEVDEREAEPMKPPRVVTPPAPRRRRKNRYQFKKKAKPAGLSLDALLETIYDVLEKKTMSDEVTRKDGVEPASLEQFVRTYFRGKLGLKKLAREKATGLFRRAAQLVGKSGRVRLFAIAVGLVSYEVDGVEAHYSPHLAHCLTALLGALHRDREGGLDSINVALGSYPEGAYLIPKTKIVHAIIGSKGLLDTTCVRELPETWRNPVLLQHLSPREIQDLLSDVDDLPETGVKGVDLDKVLWLLLDHHARATTKHEAWLKAAFLKFDDDAPGLQEIEFVRLCRWALGPSFDDLSSLDVHNLFRQIGDLADQAGTGGDDIDDAEGFPKAIIQLDCALARPRRCRIYRTMGEDEEWVTEEPSPTAPLTRAKIGQLRHERSKRRFLQKA